MGVGAGLCVHEVVKKSTFCASVYSCHYSLHSLLVFNGNVSVTDELEHAHGFPYFSLAVKSRRPFPDEPINSTDVFPWPSVCRQTPHA